MRLALIAVRFDATGIRHQRLKDSLRVLTFALSGRGKHGSQIYIYHQGQKYIMLRQTHFVDK